MTNTITTGRARPLRGFRALALVAVAMFAAAFGLQAATGSANAATSGPAAASLDHAHSAALATVHGCPYYDLCLYEGYNYTGTIHKMYNCEVYDTSYPIHSAVNNQTPHTQARFWDTNYRLIYTSPAPLWQDGNTDNNGLSTPPFTGLNSAFHVQPCVR